MARKETYTAKWNGQRPTIDGQGKVRMSLEIQHRDPGRRVDVYLTDEELDSFTKAAREARVRHAVELERAQHREQASKLQLHVWDLERKNQELKGIIERVHDVVHPDRSSVVDSPQRPVVVAPASNVAH
jgi:hypothetical protein